MKKSSGIMLHDVVESPVAESPSTVEDGVHFCVPNLCTDKISTCWCCVGGHKNCEKSKSDCNATCK